MSLLNMCKILKLSQGNTTFVGYNDCGIQKLDGTQSWDIH